MANQMIALQTRGPQLPDPSRQTAQYANMMTMARQSEAAQRQAEQAQQTMDINAARETRDIGTYSSNQKKADLDYQITNMKRLRNLGVVVMQTEDPASREAAYQSLVDMIGDADEQFGATIRRVAPTFNAKVLQALIMEADKFTDKTIPTPTTSMELTGKGGPLPENTAVQVQLGGVNGPSMTPVGLSTGAAAAPTAAPQTPTAAPMRATQGSATTPQDLMNQGMDPAFIPSGSPVSRPISFNQGDVRTPTAGQMSPEVMSNIVNSAFETGVMAQVDFDQLMATQAPQNRQALMDSFRRANISLQADAPSLASSGMGQQQSMANPVQTPQSQFANLPNSNAGMRGSPPFESTLAQYQPLQRRDPNVSPYPGSAQVPLTRVAAEAQAGRPTPQEAAANARATRKVDIELAPELATATKKAERAIQLKAEAPKERNVATRLIANIDDRINTIDRLLRNPERRSIIGRIEGNTPYFLQNETQSDAQADFDKIKNTDTLTSLVEMKQDSPTGGSPVGNASNSDVILVARGANALIQTGTLPKFDAELMEIRRQLYRTRSNTIKFYNDTYGDVVAADPRLKLTVPAIADRYISSKDLPKQKTPVKTPTSRLSAETRKKYGL